MEAYSLTTLLLTVFISSSLAGQIQPDPATTSSNLRQLLTDHFSKERSYIKPANKNETRQYIHNYFNELAQTNTSRYDSKLQGYTVKYRHIEAYNAVNYYLVAKGKRWGTANDRISILMAHYDTQTSTPGVDDNGSGMAVMMETARVLIKEGCVPPVNTVIFVAVDAEEMYLMGSKNFVDDVLVPILKNYGISSNTYYGAVILETIMNYDPTLLSQSVPFGFNLILPEADQTLKRLNYSGNFLGVIGRRDDTSIQKELSLEWAAAAYGEITPYLLNLTLPFSGNPTEALNAQQQAAMTDLLKRSDHYYFWESKHYEKGLKALCLTDTANLRGYMGRSGENCYHHPCDNLTHLTPPRLQFLTRTTGALIRLFEKITTDGNTECPVSRAPIHCLSMTSLMLILMWLILQ